jgi:hypothetical protein
MSNPMEESSPLGCIFVSRSRTHKTTKRAAYARPFRTQITYLTEYTRCERSQGTHKVITSHVTAQAYTLTASCRQEPWRQCGSSVARTAHPTHMRPVTAYRHVATVNAAQVRETPVSSFHVYGAPPLPACLHTASALQRFGAFSSAALFRRSDRATALMPASVGPLLMLQVARCVGAANHVLLVQAAHGRDD